MVGASGFEPETFCTPSKRATSLRYAPFPTISKDQTTEALSTANLIRAAPTWHARLRPPDYAEARQSSAFALRAMADKALRPDEVQVMKVAVPYQ
jgi:hypothetical protein